LIIESGKDMSVKVMDGDNTITVQQGSISLDAANAITILSGNGPLTIELGGGKIELNDGKLSIQGATVSIEGNSVAVTGQSVQMMGGGGPAAVASKSVASTPSVFDDKYIIINESSGLPLANLEYAMVRQNGDIEHGITDDAGHTHLLSSQVAPEDVNIYIGESL